ERQKAGKARSIKGKQLKNSCNTVSKPLVVLHSSARDNYIISFNNAFISEALLFLYVHIISYFMWVLATKLLRRS
ncbi:MAG: hypothetical protein ACLS27_07970, partial [Eubacterium sp.]